MKRVFRLFTTAVLILTMCVFQPMGALKADAASTSTTSSYEPSGFKFSGKVYLIGDSTVCEYPASTSYKLGIYGWGMKFAEQYTGVTVTNKAISGASSRSYMSSSYYSDVKKSLGKGDYLFIQFGHNDEKKTDKTLGTYTGLAQNTLDSTGKNKSGQYSYEFMLKTYIDFAKSKGAVPVLVTPVTRRKSNGNADYSLHTEYQSAMKAVGKECNVPVIDMTTLTTDLYTNIMKNGGATETAKYHSYLNENQYELDLTHLSRLGATKFAQMIAEETQKLGLTIGKKRISNVASKKSSYEPDGFKFSGRIVLVGDSTVCDYKPNTINKDGRYGWGMKIGQYFNGVAVENLAVGGTSSRSFLQNENYAALKKILNKGDYLFIQFGHNDEVRGDDPYNRATYTDVTKADSTGKATDGSGKYSYQVILYNYYVKLAKERGAVPVFVTSIAARHNDGSPYIDKHKEYQEAMKTLGRQYNVPVIDMTTKTAEVYQALCDQGKGKETAKYHSYTDATRSTIDNVHLSETGADMVASMIAPETKTLGLTLANYLKKTSNTNTNTDTNTNTNTNDVNWTSYEPSNFKFSGKIYLVGDSTVSNQASSDSNNLNRYGWGQKLAAQYSGVTVTNLACGGASSRNYINTSAYSELKNSLAKGDYLFIQFGHCDSISGRDTETGLDQSKLDKNGKNSKGQYSYEYFLMNYYVNFARQKGAVPVLVTPITYRKTDGTASYAGLTKYQNAMIALGKQYHIPVIDMTAETIKLCSSAASESAKLYSYADSTKKTRDTMHLSSAGATKVASLIANQTKTLGLTVGKKLASSSNTNTNTNTNTAGYEPSGFKFSGKVYLVGDSTVSNATSSDSKNLNRYGWGQMLAAQYSGVTVTNLACGGASSRNFINTSAYVTLKNSLGKGDYLFIQFGHCDSISGRDTETGLAQSTLDKNGKNSKGQYSYEYFLMTYYVNLARERGAVPVFVTPITYRKADGTASYAGLTKYQKAMITLGKEQNIPVIDMTAETIKYCSSSATESAKLYAYADTMKKTRDTMHLSSAGATKVAVAIAAKTKTLGLTIGTKIK